MLLIIKINFFAFLYALLLFIETELLLNSYRLHRMLSWFNVKTNVLLGCVIFIVLTIIFYSITTKYLDTGKFRYFLTVLWIPYYIILVLLFAHLVPITYPGDEPLGGVAFIILGMFFIFPLYVAAITAIGTKD
ncbi:hypothetical protein Dhaf_2846 [Desulfitobacterium hafniense DCB-2]|uniref:Uncharacterized protein n=4 Tax=root TaxID=1 RepID=Q24WV4_DESHY|nr:hypothetical protein Dhaf_2846 [Desulfitobacterium hafniense DCB-2]EHL04790.1 hypothetical protein HMPREF0322_04571 [Desulfitobacterium hafniense DP7]BAE83488.1 hypothetical protein DSY1699 [Desulfitobacterium hafniense Y51]